MTAWERDVRPSMPCVVCDEAPDHELELPRLADVHVAFASPTLCDACWQAARTGDVDELTRRANGFRPDEPEIATDLVRTVLAAVGRVPPAKAQPPEEYRAAAPPSLSGADAAIWRTLEPLIYDGPDHRVVVSGRIEYSDEQSVTLVHRDGPRARLADEHDVARLITDGVTTWHRHGEHMISEPHRPDAGSGEGLQLAGRRGRADVEHFGFGDPVGPIEAVECLGRPAWRFRFAAPAHKPFDMRVVVDAETGFVLDERFGDFSVARWTSFVTDEPVDASMFRWDGPTVSSDEIHAAREREHDDDMAARARWFAEHVTVQPLSVRGEAVSVLVHMWEDDGSFDASLDGGLDGALARRPRSDEWWALGWSEVTRRWSDERWDWALSVWTGEVNPADLDALVRALEA